MIYNMKSRKTYDGIVAVYDRTAWVDNIPVVILRDASVMDETRRKDTKWSVDGVIVLTMDDLQQWADAFALTLVYLQQTTTISHWEDVLHELAIERHHVRLHIEILARQMMIDAREFMIVDADIDQHRDYLERADQRIAVWYEFLWYKYSHSLTSSHDRSESMQNLLAITQHIDSME